MAGVFSPLLLSFLMTSPYAETVLVPVPDPETWYRDGYAPLYEADPAGNIEAMIGYYAASVESHYEDGTIKTVSAHDFVALHIEGALADGWLTSKLQDLQVEPLNRTTASFKASWIDRYEGEPDGLLLCDWRLADFVDGAWKFTTYVDLDCASHGFLPHDN